MSAPEVRFSHPPPRRIAADGSEWVSAPWPEAWAQRMWLDGTEMVFELERPADSANQPPSGNFVEGLWLTGTAEWFFAAAGREDSPYAEVHLSPAGEWWVSVLAGKRVRAEPQSSVPCARVEAVPGTETIRLTFQQAELEAFLGFSLAVAVGNACAILPDGNGGRKFWSHANLGGEQPDFHRPEDFLPIRWPAGGLV